jgi:hypothetical protein
VTLEAGQRGSGGIPARAAAGPVGEGPGRSPSSPRSGWALGFGRGNHRRAAHRQPAVAATAASQFLVRAVSYGPPWAHYLGGYQDRLLGGPLGLPGLRYTASGGVEHKDSKGVVLG